MSLASPHPSSHRGVDERFTRRTKLLIVLAQVMTLPGVTEGTLHDPRAWQHATNPVRPESLAVDDGTDRGPNAPLQAFASVCSQEGQSCTEGGAVMSDSETLFRSLHALYEKLRASMRQRWDRDLPLEELLFDRWQRANTLGFGEGSSIYHNSYVYGDVKVGKNTWIGPYTLLDGSGGIVIGEYCSISSGVHIYTHDTVKWALSGGKMEYERAPVRIGRCCYIGSQTVIAKGVNIGDHCLIGSCSFVNRDLPAYSVGLGIPCRPAGRIEVDEQGAVNIILSTKTAEIKC